MLRSRFIGATCASAFPTTTSCVGNPVWGLYFESGCKGTAFFLFHQIFSAKNAKKMHFSVWKMHFVNFGLQNKDPKGVAWVAYQHPIISLSSPYRSRRHIQVRRAEINSSTKNYPFFGWNLFELHHILPVSAPVDWRFFLIRSCYAWGMNHFWAFWRECAKL